MSSHLNLTLESELQVSDIHHAELGQQEEGKCTELSLEKVQSVSNYFGLVVPLLVSFYYSWSKKQRLILQLLRNHIGLVEIEQSLRAVSFGEALQSIFLIRRILQSLKELRLAAALQKKLDGSNVQPNAIITNETPRCDVNCEVLHDPDQSDRAVDVIFVHGIKGALNKTWTQGLWSFSTLKVLNMKEEKAWEINNNSTSDGQEERSGCWPKDWMPKDCPNARVIAIDYTTDPYLWRPFFINKVNRTCMEERSWEMIYRLLELGVGERPIIWVAHSKGGLYVKQMLVSACETLDGKYSILANNTKGILFYSVPHRGSLLANLNFPLCRRSVELLEVQKNCTNVLNLHQKFKRLFQNNQLTTNVKSFIETRLTLMGFLYVQIVSTESADVEVGEMYGVPLDHRNICKPKNRECFLYQELVKVVQGVCEQVS